MNSRLRSRLWMAILVALAANVVPLLSQEPEVIILDPDQPLIQNPGTVNVAAEEPPETVSISGQGGNVREVLAGLWFRYRALLQRGERDEANAQIEAALDLMNREGLRAVPEIAGALLVEGQRALQDGDYRRARENLRMAARFDPTLAAARFGSGLAILRGDRDPIGAAREIAAGIRALVRDPESMYYLAGRVVPIAFVALLGTGILALLILMLRSAPAFFHDLQERRAGKLSQDGAHLLGWLILAIPLLFIVPLPFALALWVVLLFPYARLTERVVLIGVLLALAVAGPFAEAIAWHHGTATDPRARALIQSVHYGPGLRQERAFIELMRDEPTNPMYPFLLASAYRGAGRLDDAARMLQRTLEIDPAHARARVNLGNIFALRQEYARAQDQYRQASQADPQLALAYYNSHLAHLEAFHLEAADEALTQARSVDEALVTGLLERAGGRGGRKVPIECEYTSGEIWKQAMQLRGTGGVKRHVLRAVSATSTLAGAAGVLAVVFLPGLGLAPRRGTARRCRRCGGAFCRRCQVTTKDPDYCSQCMHLFILRDGLAPGVKGRKLEEVMRYRRRTFFGTRILSLFLPGSGQLIGGRALFGASMLAVWLGSLIGLMGSRFLLVAPGRIAGAGDLYSTVPLLTLALLAWLIGNLSAHDAARE